MRNRPDGHRPRFRKGLPTSSSTDDKSIRFSMERMRIAASAGRALLLSAGAAKSPRKKPPGVAIPCRCGHPKSIHARMYGNPKLGTPCNFPECRCKAYRPA